MKRVFGRKLHSKRSQPPSGGCVLKPHFSILIIIAAFPAAFRRLCVETGDAARTFCPKNPAAFRRLCVETTYNK